MRQIGVHEAKTHLSELLREVEAGAEIVLCRGGQPVARLTPFDDKEARHDAAVRRMDERRARCRLDGLTIRELIDDGRRY